MFLTHTRAQTMTHDTQHSFIATLQIPNHNLDLLGILYGQPIIVTDSFASGGFFSGRPQTRDDSAAVGIQPHAIGGVKEPLTLYFRYTGKGYEIHIKHTGKYDRHRLAKHYRDILYAKNPTLKDPITFTLFDLKNALVTGPTLPKEQTLITLKTHHNKSIGIQKVKGSPHHYLAEVADRNKTVFMLSILERNVPY